MPIYQLFCLFTDSLRLSVLRCLSVTFSDFLAPPTTTTSLYPFPSLSFVLLSCWLPLVWHSSGSHLIQKQKQKVYSKVFLIKIAVKCLEASSNKFEKCIFCKAPLRSAGTAGVKNYMVFIHKASSRKSLCKLYPNRLR